MMDSNVQEDGGDSVLDARTTESRHPCVSCQRRKVKCDRKSPCSRCLANGQDCRQPETRRAPRRARRAAPGLVSEKLRQLEKSLDEVRAAVLSGKSEETSETADIAPTESAGQSQPLETSLGRLIIEDENSRYISSSSWANLADQVSDLRILVEDDGSVAEFDSPDHSLTEPLFNKSSPSEDVSTVQSSQEGLPYLWTKYVENVDPIMKVLHVPTSQAVVEKAIACRQDVPKDQQCLLAAVKFAAVSSLSDEDCLAYLNTSRLQLLSFFRSEVHSTLKRSNYLVSHNFVTLQALVIYLVCNRRHENPRLMWILSGITIRLAQSIGLHRDGTFLGLPIFATEMRRRLYWEIRMLDLACAEDSGFLPTHIYGSDTRLPLNINDKDLNQGDSEWPVSSTAFTETTFALIRFEICNRIHRFNSRDGRCSIGVFTGDIEQVQEQAKDLENCKLFVEEKYFNQCSISIPLQKTALNIGRIMFAKLFLIVQYPQIRSRSSSLPKSELFDASCNILEWTNELIADLETRPFSWMLQAYVHWHPVAFLLKELVERPEHEQASRAWNAINVAFANPHGLSPEANQAIFQPLRGLLQKAMAAAGASQRGSLALNASTAHFPPWAYDTPNEYTQPTEDVQNFMDDPMNFPIDESLLGFDLHTPIITMSDFMTDVPQRQDKAVQSWWPDGGSGMAYRTSYF